MFQALMCPSSGEISCPIHVEKRNKHGKKNCAPSWLYLQGYARMHGQQNIKKGNLTFSLMMRYRRD
jgi:hypothetical protein